MAFFDIVTGGLQLFFGAVNDIEEAKAKELAQEVKARTVESQARNALVRKREEEELQKERIAFEAQLEKENLAFELKIAAESTDVAVDRTSKIFEEVRGTQRLAAASAGLAFTGSTKTVMDRSTRNFRDEVNEIRRAFTVFSEARTLESEQFGEGQELTLEQFLSRSKRESHFEQINRANEALLFRLGGDIALSQGNRAAIGNVLSGASNIIGGIADSRESGSV